jgi:hypothetical protein
VEGVLSWQWWIDVQRGYTDADFESMLEKLATRELRKPGSVIEISRAELRAYHALMRTAR